MPGSTLTGHRAHHARQIREAAEKIIAANALLEVRVIAARKQKIPWKLIADSVGCTRQAATERFSRLPEIAALDERA